MYNIKKTNELSRWFSCDIDSHGDLLSYIVSDGDNIAIAHIRYCVRMAVRKYSTNLTMLVPIYLN